MLNPSAVTDAIVAVLRSIPELAAAMTVEVDGQPVVRIDAFHYLLGAEHRLAEAVYKMPAPSMLIAYDGTKGGNFSGYQIWKHRWKVFIRMGNAAGLTSPVGYEDLWWIICSKPPNGDGPNIRQIQIYPGLDIMDTPDHNHTLDEDLVDRFEAVFIIPEIGDN